MPLETLYNPLKRMLVEILSWHGVEEAEISVSFVGRDKIRALNREYLGCSRITDVLAFDLSDSRRAHPGRPSEKPLIGDIYICAPRAVEQAADFGVSQEEELLRLAAHGVLHLLGYDHQDGDQARRMNQLQEEMVRKYCRVSNSG